MIISMAIRREAHVLGVNAKGTHFNVGIWKIFLKFNQAKAGSVA